MQDTSWHTCNYFCVDGLHCTQAVSVPLPASLVEMHMRIELAGQADVLAVTQPREADIAVWHDTLHFKYPITAAHTEAWLVFFRFA